YELTVSGELARRVVGDVVVSAGRITDLGTIEVDRGHTLTGTVVDLHGSSVAGAEVRSLDADAPAMSDGQGRFTITGLVPGVARVVASHATRGRSEVVALEAGRSAPAPVTLVLRGAGSLAGQVTVAGRTHADIAIEVAPDDAASGDAKRLARTDENGAFVLVDL